MHGWAPGTPVGMAFTRCTQSTFYASRATLAASRGFLPDRIFTDPAPGDRQPDTNHACGFIRVSNRGKPHARLSIVQIGFIGMSPSNRAFQA